MHLSRDHHLEHRDNLQPVPGKPRRFIGLEDVQDRVNLKKSAIYQKIKEGKFPKRYANGWLESDIEKYIDDVIAAGPNSDS